MLPALLPLRYKLRLRNSAVASSIGSHSRTREVCVALRQRSMGAVGEFRPNVWRIVVCRLVNAFWAADSEERLRETVISTMEPEDMSGGRRMDGNSIYYVSQECALRCILPTILLSSVRRTAMPASTLPTVSETNMVAPCRMRDYV